MSTDIVITGGGTGGHVFPALSIAGELNRRGYSILYLGSSRGLEADLAPKKGLPFQPIPSGAVKNQGPTQLFKTVFSLIRGVWRSVVILHHQKPKAVIGVGGYVSVPVCIAAYLLRIPIFLQEQNVSVGIANRFLGRLSQKIFLGFQQAIHSFNPRKCVVTGNPIRPELARKNSGAYRPEGKVVLVLGGSQGARAINDLILGLGSQFPSGTRIRHQTGPKDFERVRDAYQKLSSVQVEVVPFIEDMGHAYNEASLVISRSGALTVSELIEVGRPAIFIPYPRKGQNDQTANAYFLEQSQAARVVEQGPEFEKRFWTVFEETFSIKTLTTMAANIARLRTPPALATIADLIQADLKETASSV